MAVKVNAGTRTIGAVPHHYSVNVAKDGLHLFATAEHSIPDKSRLDRVMEIFRRKFPAEEGYSVTVTAEYSFGIIEEKYQIGKRGW